MADIVIFGAGDFAEQAHYYFQNDSEHRVVGFSLSADYITSENFQGLPVVAFEKVEQDFDPQSHQFFVAVSGRRMNRDRARFYLEAKQKGYDLASYVSSKAILCDNKIGDNCFILENTNLQPFVTVGNNVTIWCSSHVGHHSIISDHNYICSQVGISGRCVISPYCFLAGHSKVDLNVRLAEGTLLGLGTIVKQDTEPWSIYTGHPAKKRKVSSRDFEFLK